MGFPPCPWPTGTHRLLIQASRGEHLATACQFFSVLLWDHNQLTSYRYDIDSYDSWRSISFYIISIHIRVASWYGTSALGGAKALSSPIVHQTCGAGTGPGDVGSALGGIAPRFDGRIWQVDGWCLTNAACRKSKKTAKYCKNNNMECHHVLSFASFCEAFDLIWSHHVSMQWNLL
jgi:hypothetical protein